MNQQDKGRGNLNLDLIARENPKHRASNRLLKKGWTREQVNKYLAETPLETINKHNRENKTPD